jgi:type IV pilus assembly protein PilY1
VVTISRIDFVDPANPATTRNSSQWTIQKIASVASDSGRKFLFGPSVLLAQNRAYLTIGSGDRERPLVNNYPYVQDVQNRFYMFVDTFTSSGDSDVNLDGDQLANNTSGSTCISPTSTLRGWRMDLPGQGEQTVTSSLIVGGRIIFNTHRAVPQTGNICNANLGEARGYNVGLLCADKFSVIYNGIGLAISPVQGTVTLSNGRVQTFVLGGPTAPSVNTPFAPGKVTPAISQRRSRVYWYNHGDK